MYNKEKFKNMNTRFFICHNGIMVVPSESQPYLMNSDNNKFIQHFTSHECQEHINEHPEKEISFALEPKLPEIPYWHHIKALDSRAIDPRIPSNKQECWSFAKDNNLEVGWNNFNSLRGPKHFFVRSNEEEIEFLVIDLKNYYEWYREGNEVKIIGTTPDYLLEKPLRTTREDSQVVFGKIYNIIPRNSPSDFYNYVACTEEIVNMTEEVFRRRITKKEFDTINGAHYSFRSDIWK